MFCKRCGTQMPEGTMFCHKCGANISTQTIATPATNTQGKTLILIGGILAIIGGIWALLVSLGSEMIGFSITSGYLFALSSAIAGIIGIVNHKKTETASMQLVVWAARISLIILVIWVIVYFQTFGFIDWFSDALLAAPHILLWVGVVKNK